MIRRGLPAVFLLFFLASALSPQNPPDLGAFLKAEMQRSKPDYVVYVPGSVDGSTFDTGNEHFLVFDAPDGSLMAIWTQSTFEGAGDHRIMFTRSTDEGETWSTPKRLVGPARKGEGPMASWGFPLTSKSGRIYVVYNQQQETADVHPQITGTMDCIFSDDLGTTWSRPETIPMPRSRFDSPDASIASNWIVWQKPIRDLKDRWFNGFTRWVSKAVRTPPHTNFSSHESVVEFMRFENIDANPRPPEIRVTYTPDTQALRVPHYTNPLLSIAQEPSLLRLPDKRLFCVMRSMTGYIWYSVSGDDGQRWTNPRPLLRRDHGLPIRQPLSCTPMYEISAGRYFLLHHDNDGRFQGTKPEDTSWNRRPCYLVLGEFRKGADQPVWFSESKLLMDNEGAQLGPLKRIDIGLYTSFTNRCGNAVLWHPERKFFLLGKRITSDFLADLKVPER